MTEEKQELKELQDKAGAEYDEGWEEAEKVEAKEKEAASGEGLPPGSEKKEEELEARKEEEPSEKEESEPEPKKEVSKDHGDLDSVTRALKDTKAYATRLAMENAELVRKNKAFEEGKATQEEVDAAKKAVQEAKDNLDEAKTKIYEDYPEFKTILDPLIERTRKLESELKDVMANKTKEDEEVKEKKKRLEALDHFNEFVKPSILEVHKDFDKVVKNPVYFQWAAEQSPALRFAAMDSGDPKDIIWAVTEYKRFMASDAAKELKQKQNKENTLKVINAQTLRGGSPVPFTGKKVKADDYDAGWDEAGKALEKEGVGFR